MSKAATAPAPAASGAIHPDVHKAELFAFHQRRAGLRFLKMSKRIAGNPADVAMCERVVAAAKDDPGEFENLITFAEVNALFCRGALFYQRGKN